MLTLIENGEVFAPEPLGHQTVVLGGEKILGLMAPDASISEELVSQRVDATDHVVTPGLIDGHVHITGGGGEAGPATRVPRLHLSAFTSRGVTTAIGLLGTDDLTHTTAELLAVTRGLRDEGLSAYCHTGGYHLPPTTLTGSVRGDIVHLDPVLGLGELALSDHRSSQPTLDELLRIASEVHVAGLMTNKAGIVHLHVGDGDRGLDLIRAALAQAEIPARVFQPTHVNRRKALFEEALEVAEKGCVIDITAFPPAEEEADEYSAPDALELAWERGAPTDRITVSSDAGGCLPCFGEGGRIVSFEVGQPGAMLLTLQEMLARGHSMEQALQPLTQNVADLLRLRSKGRIEAGRDADLLVLRPDGQLRDVFARGVCHYRDSRCEVVGTFEDQPGERA